MNIAVAEFGQAGDGEAVKPWDRGAELASRFATELNERRAPLDQAAAQMAGSAVEIRGPELTGRITGETTGEREKAADKLASEFRRISSSRATSSRVGSDFCRRFSSQVARA